MAIVPIFIALTTIAGIVVVFRSTTGNSNWGLLGDLFDSILVGGIASFIASFVLLEAVS